ncbi:MAG: zinc-binding dehydrogenase [Rhizomicrobium sp.]
MSPQTMRAVLTTAHGGREVLKAVRDYAVPRAGSGQVVVAVAATALNFHDIFTRRGMPGIKIALPVVVGSDIAGTIAEIGDEVDGWKIGDPVLINPILRDGRVGMIGETADGGRAEYVAVSAAQLLRVPGTVSLADAAALPLAYGTAHRMLFKRGKLHGGETILVLGASGGVGAACVQLAKMTGATVIACASTPSKLARLREAGADHLIDYSAQSFFAGVKEIVGKPRLSGEGGVDVAVNFTGGDTWEETQRCVKQCGRILTCGATAGYAVRQDMRFLWTFEHDVLGSNGWSDDDLVALMDLIAAGRFRPLIDRVLPLEDAREAERLLEDREVVGKVLLSP